jgi:hypothetical protein
LSCLGALLCDAKLINMYAPFTLVRGALENACGAVWLLQPEKRDERLEQRLRQAIADLRYEEQARELMQQQDAQAAQRRIAEVREIASRAGIGGSH